MFIKPKKLSYLNVSISKYELFYKSKDMDDAICILYNINLSDLDLINIDNYYDLSQSVIDFREQKINKRYSHIILDDVKFYYKDINKITYGEYLDCLSYIKSNDITKLMSIFYRRGTERKFDSIDFEPYEFDIDIRSQYFRDKPVSYFFQIKSDLEKLDNIIKTSFKSLFESDEEQTNVDQLEGRDKAMFIHNQKIKQSYNDRAWEYVTYTLSNEDITKFDEVYNKPLFTIFNYLLLQRDMELRSKNKGM